MARESAEGQAFELGWRRDNVTDVGEADYLEMVLRRPAGSPRFTPAGSAFSSEPEEPSTRTDASGSAFFLAQRFKFRTICSTWWATPTRMEGTWRRHP